MGSCIPLCLWLGLLASLTDKLPSVDASVFRVGGAGSSEFLSILVYPLVGHWRRAERERELNKEMATGPKILPFA